MSNPPRKWTCLVQDAIRDGLLSADAVADMCLQYMDEADVAAMARANDLVAFLDPQADEDSEDADEVDH